MSEKNNNNWGWFDVLNPKQTQGKTKQPSYSSSTHNDEIDFELVNDTASISSLSKMSTNQLLDDNFQINDHYMNNNHNNNNPSIHSINDDDDEKTLKQINSKLLKQNIINNIICISPKSITLQTDRDNNKQSDQSSVISETWQLRQQCLSPANSSIAQIEEHELESLQVIHVELQATLDVTQSQLKKAKEEIQRLKRENDNLHKKLNIFCANRLSMNNNNDNARNDVAIPTVHYCCIHCQKALFDEEQIVQQTVEINDNSVGCLVKEIFNENVTMGPRICKNFLNGMFKVNQVFCDGCLTLFGWKIVESFEEWNSFRQGKYCINISGIQKTTVDN